MPSVVAQTSDRDFKNDNRRVDRNMCVIQLKASDIIEKVCHGLVKNDVIRRLAHNAPKFPHTDHVYTVYIYPC